MKSLAEILQHLFTPAHRRPIDEHLLREEATREMITEAEELLNRMTDKADGKNRKQTIKRKQKNWLIKVKVTQQTIKVFMKDTKFSNSAVHKRITIVCFRKYVKSKDGVGICKMASIHYVKDGRAHVRSIKESPLFQGIFFRIHRLDEAFIHGGSLPSLEVTASSLKHQASLTEDVRLLHDEAKRYVDTLKTFTVDPLIENRLVKLIEQLKKLQADFDLLDYEEKHTVRRMFRQDIPQLMNTFLALSLKHQLEQKEDVFVSLSRMELTLIDFQEQLEKARMEKMEHLIRLQTLRYERQNR
ncbi:hypothetical protein [Halalkalibacter urbisdiaboli]|uniref:hypothetical protein n=1 Tax=Halalkalibacter urbisdiaboli TaxID=1960589 RepID=UPI000B439AF0|nr:hypothetical protein [Halalkalibacter urbisdiaboli]